VRSCLRSARAVLLASNLRWLQIRSSNLPMWMWSFSSFDSHHTSSHLCRNTFTSFVSASQDFLRLAAGPADPTPKLSQYTEPSAFVCLSVPQQSRTRSFAPNVQRQENIPFLRTSRVRPAPRHQNKHPIGSGVLAFYCVICTPVIPWQLDAQPSALCSAVSAFLAGDKLARGPEGGIARRAIFFCRPP